MKKILLLLLCASATIFTFAQSDKYMSNMKKNIALLDSNFSVETANSFVRIGDMEKTQWLPYYYASYCYIMQGYTSNDNSQKDALADKANMLLDKAVEILGKENSETKVIRSMIASLHLMVDPQSRFMTYGTAAANYNAEAMAMDSTNPRPILLDAQMKFYTPEMFGGGKKVALPIFEKAKKMFSAFKPETEISPVWGEGTLNYFLSMYKE